MAAVTLLALANGAGDVITALVASGAEGGISYNIGALYGAGFFVCSVNNYFSKFIISKKCKNHQKSIKITKNIEKSKK